MEELEFLSGFVATTESSYLTVIVIIPEAMLLRNNFAGPLVT